MDIRDQLGAIVTKMHELLQKRSTVNLQAALTLLAYWKIEVTPADLTELAAEQIKQI